MLVPVDHYLLLFGRACIFSKRKKNFPQCRPTCRVCASFYLGCVIVFLVWCRKFLCPMPSPAVHLPREAPPIPLAQKASPGLPTLPRVRRPPTSDDEIMVLCVRPPPPASPNLDDIFPCLRPLPPFYLRSFQSYFGDHGLKAIEDGDEDDVMILEPPLRTPPPVIILSDSE